MNMTPSTPVIVVAEERRRRRGIAWVAGGAALTVAALGGGTFALWSDSESFAGGTITAGDLDLRKIEDTAFYDISPDRDDISAIEAGGAVLKDPVDHHNVSGDASVAEAGVLMGHPIEDLSTWRIVPGDTIAAVARFRVQLVGDNLVAELSADPEVFTPGLAANGDVTVPEPQASDSPATQRDDNGFGDPSLRYNYTLYDTNGQVVSGYDHIPLVGDGTFDGHLAYFSAPQAGQQVGLADGADQDAATDSGGNSVTVPVIQLDATVDPVFTIAVEATFVNAQNREDVGAAEALGGLALSLNQLRAGTEDARGYTGIGAQQTN